MNFASTRIITKDVPALGRFYEHVTGISPWIGSPEYLEFRTTGGTLAIGSEHTMEQHGASGAISQANRSAILEFRVSDVDQEYQRLLSRAKEALHAIEFVLLPTDQPWGNRSMLFRDPDGNLINFFAPILSTKN